MYRDKVKVEVMYKLEEVEQRQALHHVCWQENKQFKARPSLEL